MKSFKTIVGQWSYPEDFDKELTKNYQKIVASGHDVLDVEFVVGGALLCAVITYEEKQKSSKRGSLAAEASKA